MAVFDLAIYAKIQEQRWANVDSSYYNRVIVRLGEFHIIMSFLSVLGKRFGAGGLTDLWVEADIVAPGSVNAALQGRHYNRSVRAHKVVYEALSRLQMQDYLNSLPDAKQNDFMDLAHHLSAVYHTPDDVHSYLERQAINTSRGI